jgi:hypothetical protein
VAGDLTNRANIGIMPAIRRFFGMDGAAINFV